MNAAGIGQVESELGISLPEEYRNFLLSSADEIRRLDDELSYVVTPWVEAQEMINGNREAFYPSKNRLVVAGNGAGDYWFIELIGDRAEIWTFEHETGEIERGHASPEAWLEYLRTRLAEQRARSEEAAAKVQREFAELSYDGAGISSLFRAAQDMESMERLTALVAGGHEVNTRNQNKFAATPLQGAVGRGNLATVKILLEAGADPNLSESNGNTALHGCGEPEIAKLLLNAGGNPNARNELGATPLHSCAFFGRDEVAELLLKRGADPSIANETGQLPLNVAMARGKEGMVRILSE